MTACSTVRLGFACVAGMGMVGGLDVPQRNEYVIGGAPDTPRELKYTTADVARGNAVGASGDVGGIGGSAVVE